MSEVQQAASVWVFSNLLPLIVAAGLVWWQMWHQTVTNSVKFAFELRQYFDAPEMKEHRAKISTKLRAGQPLDPLDDDVLAFFDAVGYNVKRKAVDQRAVWNHLGWEILRYWCAAINAGAVERLRHSCADPSLYDNFKTLYDRVVAIEQGNRQLRTPEEVKPSLKELDRFLDYESGLEAEGNDKVHRTVGAAAIP